jgi:hypothetical protein
LQERVKAMLCSSDVVACVVQQPRQAPANAWLVVNN